MGRIICVGLGPGDPELMSVKAARILASSRHVAFFCKRGAPGQARKIVEGLIPEDAVEHRMEYPVTTEIPFQDSAYEDQLNPFYDDWAERLVTLAAGEDVTVLCVGDPFLYGSYIHLYLRLKGRVKQEIVPGITGISGCWTATGLPMTWGNEILSILAGTLTEDELVENIERSDAVAIIKTGRNLPKIRQALTRTGRLQDAWLVQNGTMAEEKVAPLCEVTTDKCPYFSTIILHGKGRRL